jgi:hypothetical protein
MRDCWTRALLLVCGGVLATLLVAVPIQAGPPPQDVTVINTAANPLPVAVQGTPTVNAQQQGTWNVGVTNTDAKQSVQRTTLVILPAGTQIDDETMYTVPAGKRLVIEQASVRAQLGSGTHAAMPFIRTFGPSLGVFYVPLTPLGAFAGMGEVQIGSEHIRAYAVAGSNVDASITVDTATGGSSRFEVTFAGYLVDA